VDEDVGIGRHKQLCSRSHRWEYRPRPAGEERHSLTRFRARCRSSTRRGGRFGSRRGRAAPVWGHDLVRSGERRTAHSSKCVGKRCAR
jgi:hypothetical protein